MPPTIKPVSAVDEGVNPTSQRMVAVSNVSDIVAPAGDAHSVPAVEQDVGVMVQFLGNFSDPVDEFQRRREVPEFHLALEPAMLAVFTPPLRSYRVRRGP